MPTATEMRPESAHPDPEARAFLAGGAMVVSGAAGGRRQRRIRVHEILFPTEAKADDPRVRRSPRSWCRT
jgi:hypothetical protein